MPDLGEHQHRLSKGGLDRRAMAEIGRDRLPETLFIVRDHGTQPRQPVEPRGAIRRRLGPRPRDHGLEALGERRQRSARQRSTRQGAIQCVVQGGPPKIGVSPLFCCRKLAVCGTSGKCRANRPESAHLTVIKSKKTSPRPFPKAARVGTYRSHPTGFAPGLPSRDAFGTGEASHASGVGPDPTSPAFSLKARNGLTRGGAAR